MQHEDELSERSEISGIEIAVIGMAGRFPGANDTGTFWRNLRDGVESITALSDADLLARGVSASQFDATLCWMSEDILSAQLTKITKSQILFSDRCVYATARLVLSSTWAQALLMDSGKSFGISGKNSSARSSNTRVSL